MLLSQKCLHFTVLYVEEARYSRSKWKYCTPHLLVGAVLPSLDVESGDLLPRVNVDHSCPSKLHLSSEHGSSQIHR